MGHNAATGVFILVEPVFVFGGSVALVKAMDSSRFIHTFETQPYKWPHASCDVRQCLLVQECLDVGNSTFALLVCFM